MDVYVVTGASRGLGWSLVRNIGKDASTLAISRSGLPQRVDNAEDLRCDLATAEGQRTAAAAVSKKLASQDWSRAVLINNAGMVEPVGPVESCDPELLSRAVSLNLTAALVLMQAFVAASQRVAARSIVNISSGAGQQARFGWTAYCATKAGLDRASEVVLAEAKARRSGLRVTSLSPGMMDTAMQDVVRGTRDAEFPDAPLFRARHAEGTLADPDAIAAKLLRLERAGKLPDGIASIQDLQ